MNDIDILCPKVIKVVLMGRECEIKPLSIKAGIELGRILGQMHTEITAHCKETGQNAPENILGKIFELAGTNKTKEIINILTCGAFRSAKNIEDNFTLYDLSVLTKAVSEVNDFNGIFLNFTRALKAAKQTPFQAP